MLQDYEQMDALALAEGIRNADFTASEVIEAAIERIEARNPQLNAVIHPLFDQARKESLRPPGMGPFSGVPFLLKDLIQVVPGVPLEMGSRFWEGFVPDPEFATTLYQRFVDSGVVLLGKTTTPELGISPTAESEFTGPTHNPWDRMRSSGGSSGGSGAAVGARIVPMASGGDALGSIRIPASCCGIFGLKPTRARTPVGPIASEHWFGFVCEHVLTRSVRDSAAMLDATHGPEETAPYHAPHEEESYLAATQHDPRPLRIAFHCDPALPASVDPDCIQAAEETAKLCEDLGHHVEPVRAEHPQMELARSLMTVIASMTAKEIKVCERVRERAAKRSDFELQTWLLKLWGETVTGDKLCYALDTLQTEARRLVDHYRDFDVILTPTLGHAPPVLGQLKPSGVDAFLQGIITTLSWRFPLRFDGVLDEVSSKAFEFIPFTPVANFTGQPSMSVPLFWNQDNLPIGSMFTAPFGDERTLFSLAAQLERAKPWVDRKPPICA